MTWTDAHNFCVGNGSKTLPTVGDGAVHEEFQSAVRRQLPSVLHSCMAWLGLRTSELSASVNWRWMDSGAEGKILTQIRFSATVMNIHNFDSEMTLV